MSAATLPTTKPLMCVRIDPALKAELERAARADQRSLSSLVAKVLRDWVQAKPAPSAKRGER